MNGVFAYALRLDVWPALRRVGLAGAVFVVGSGACTPALGAEAIVRGPVKIVCEHESSGNPDRYIFDVQEWQGNRFIHWVWGHRRAKQNCRHEWPARIFRDGRRYQIIARSVRLNPDGTTEWSEGPPSEPFTFHRRGKAGVLHCE